MPNTPHERSERLIDEMIDDILAAPIEELEQELVEQGEDLDAIADRFGEMLARAQDEVIASKLADAKAALPTLRERGSAPAGRLPSSRPRDVATTVMSLTLAARNADRPFGFDDPSLDEDLRELRSETWNDD